MALIFNLFISNQNCNSDPFLTKLGITCVIVLLENKLASNTVIRPVTAKHCVSSVRQTKMHYRLFTLRHCLTSLAKTIFDQSNNEHMWKSVNKH